MWGRLSKGGRLISLWGDRVLFSDIPCITTLPYHIYRGRGSSGRAVRWWLGKCYSMSAAHAYVDQGGIWTPCTSSQHTCTCTVAHSPTISLSYLWEKGSLCINKNNKNNRTCHSTAGLLAASLLRLVPVPRRDAHHTRWHTHALLSSVTETLVECVVLAHPICIKCDMERGALGLGCVMSGRLGEDGREPVRDEGGGRR